jgi:xanthine dehydrogenase accessory factor
MTGELLEKAHQLSSQGKPFVLAVVVRREAPVSVQPGDKALIEADGTLHGWVGGGCTRPVILHEARLALQNGRARLVRVTPEADSRTTQGVSEHAMSCHSGGSLDVFIEPVLPRTHLVILGRSAVGRALTKLGKALGYHLAVAAPGALKEDFPEADWFSERHDLSQLDAAPRAGIVICTQGEHDQQAIRQALTLKADYIALVASPKKAQGLLKELEEGGIEPQQLKSIKAPAGLDIGAHSPEEIAVSILAEFIQRLRSSDGQEAKETTEPVRDPVCGMVVDPSAAPPESTWEGKTFYFCCPGCKQAFDQHPAKYQTDFTQSR